MDQLIAGETHDPHAVLGAHPADGRTTIRTMRRGAGDVAVVVDGERHPMKRVHDVGVFATTVPGEVLDYRVEVDGTNLVAASSFGTGGRYIDTKNLPVGGTYTILIDPQNAVIGSATLTL